MTTADEFAALIDSVLGLGEPVYTGEEVAERAGVSLEQARRYWRAAGFPEIPDDERYFFDEDLQMLQEIVAILDSEFTDEETVLQVARATGQSASRLADAHISALALITSDGLVAQDGTVDEATAREVVQVAGGRLPFLRHSLDYLWRRHLAAAAKRTILSGDGANERAVGFADLTAFSALSRRLDEDALARVITRFETFAFDTIAAQGGRVVKLIGDEALFVCDGAVAAARAALALRDRCDQDDILPAVRIGLAYGRIVALEGDVFGPVVNLASRITTYARPGTILISEDMRTALKGESDLKARVLSRSPSLKGIGRVKLYSLRPQPVEG